MLRKKTLYKFIALSFLHTCHQKMESISVSDNQKQSNKHQHLPLLSRNFIGRERELTQLRQLLASDRMVTVTQVISDLGGIGKTQLARAYAHNNTSSYELTWWINAETTLDEDYRGLAKNLGITIDQEIQFIQKEVKSHLAQKESSLLIFDNVEDYNQVKPYIPELEGTHHVILTSRNKQVPTDWTKPLVLEALTEEESLILIYKMTRAKDKPDYQSFSDWEETLRKEIIGYDKLKAEALGLACDLGHLPLAIVQACSFIGVDGHMSQYRKDFRKTQKVLSAQKPSGYPLSDLDMMLRTMWEIAITKLERTTPMVREIVSYSAFMAPDAIPEEVISTCLKTHSDSSRFDGLTKFVRFRLLRFKDSSGNSFDQLTFTNAMKALGGKLLLTQGEGQFHVHRLVQAVGRMALSEDRQKEIIKSLLQTLNDFVKFDHQNMESWEPIKGLKSHVDSVLGYAKALGIEGKTRGRLLRELGKYLNYVRNAYEEAERYLIESVEICIKECGESHIETANSYYAIGQAYYEQEKLSEAMTYCQKALGIRQTLLGDHHPKTASSYHVIGQVYQAQGNLSNAMSYYQKALEIDEKLLGKNHPNTASSYNTIGQVYQTQGNLFEAMKYYGKALEIKEKLLGEHHAATAISYHDIGLVHQAQGNYVEALQFIQKSYDILLTQLGPNHPNTITVKNNLNNISNSKQN